MLCFLALCQIILFIYVFLLFPEVPRDVMFSGTVSDYLFIYVFYNFQKSRNVGVFLALCQIICLFM